MPKYRMIRSMRLNHTSRCECGNCQAHNPISSESKNIEGLTAIPLAVYWEEEVKQWTVIYNQPANLGDGCYGMGDMYQDVWNRY